MAFLSVTSGDGSADRRKCRHGVLQQGSDVRRTIEMFPTGEFFPPIGRHRDDVATEISEAVLPTFFKIWFGILASFSRSCLLGMRFYPPTSHFMFSFS